MPATEGARRGEGNRFWADLLGRFARPSREKGAKASQAEAPRIAVVTDTACGLHEAFVVAHSAVLTVVPMPVTVDGQVYVEGEDDVQAELTLGLAMGKKVSTSRPAPGKFQRVFADAVAAGAEAIVVVCISSKLSGTADAARLAASAVPVPVEVVDTHSVGLGEGFAVMAAVDAAERGASHAEVVAAAQSAVHSRVWFCVPSLEQLRRGGRISTAAALMGTLLNVKPLLTVDEAGAIVPSERLRSLPKAIHRMVELGAQAAGGDPDDVVIGIHHFGAREQAQDVAERLKAYTSAPVLVTPVPAVLAAHTGAGALALVVRRLETTLKQDPTEEPAAPAED